MQLNIANTKDGRLILYDINKISEIGIDSVLADENAVHADSSAASQSPNSAKGRLTQNGAVVNTKRQKDRGQFCVFLLTKSRISDILIVEPVRETSPCDESSGDKLPAGSVFAFKDRGRFCVFTCFLQDREPSPVFLAQNDRFWNEAKSHKDDPYDTHPWIGSPDEKKKMKLFTEEEQAVLRTFLKQSVRI